MWLEIFQVLGGGKHCVKILTKRKRVELCVAERSSTWREVERNSGTGSRVASWVRTFLEEGEEILIDLRDDQVCN